MSLKQSHAYVLSEIFLRIDTRSQSKCFHNGGIAL
jgi:hypothetical protein